MRIEYRNESLVLSISSHSRVAASPRVRLKGGKWEENVGMDGGDGRVSNRRVASGSRLASLITD